MKRIRIPAVAAVAIGAMVALSACGTTSTTATVSGTTDSKQAAILQTAYTGFTGTPPTDSVTPKKGVNLWVMSCGDLSPDCKTRADAGVAAGKAAGWTVHRCDGQLNPTGFATCIRQAVADKANVFIPIGIDCSSATAAFTEAFKAGVVIIGGGGSNNCPEVDGKTVWSTERLQLKDTTIQQFWENTGKLQADYLMGKTNFKVKALTVTFTDQVWGPWITEGFNAELKAKNGGEAVANFNIVNADFVNNTAAQKLQSAILKASTANSMIIPVDGWLSGNGLAAAIKQSGKDLIVIGNGGGPGPLDLIRAGNALDATVGYAGEWGAWGSVDTAIRVLNGDDPVVEGDGIQVIDKTHNLPSSGGYQGPVDFRSIYKKTWGVS